MINFKNIYKIISHVVIVIVFIFFSTLHAKNLDKFDKANNISNYFSGVVLLNQSKYSESYQYFKKLNGLEKSHSAFSSKYLYSLVNSENFIQAFNYSKKLEKDKLDSYETDLIIGLA